ncbi:MAG: hypothetical protein QXJ32_01590 [Thermoplasmata archaeon]
MKKNLVRATFAAMIASVFLMNALVLVAGHASGAGFSGTWVPASSLSFKQWDLISTRYYDCEWTVTDYGTYGEVSGTTTLVRSDRNPSYTGYDPWPAYIGVPSSFYAEVTIAGDQMIIPNSGEYQSGQIVLTLSGNTLSGSGSYNSAGVTVHYDIELKREGFLGLFSLPGGGIVTMVSLGLVVVFVVLIVTVMRPVPVTPSITRVPPPTKVYEPSYVRTTDDSMPVSLPEGGTPVGGVGLTVPPPPPAGRPLPPKEHFWRGQEPPRCPIHGEVALVAHYKSAEGDPGSWYCPKCKGYPWGRS